MSKRNFINTWLIAVLILTVCLTGFSKEKLANSLWAAPAPVIDGMYDDWLADALYSNKKMSIDYAFMNDSEYLFILFKFNDPRYLSSVNASGMKIWINTEGKEKKNFGIKFVRWQLTADQFIALLEKRRGPLTEEQKAQFLVRPHYYIYLTEFIDKKGKPLSGLSGTHTEPAIFRLRKDQKTVFFEFAVSLKAVFEIVQGVEFDPGKPISVGFEWGGMIKGMSQAQMKRMGIWEGGAEEGTPSFYNDSGGGPARRKRGAFATSRKAPKKYSFWVVVNLASKQ